MIPIVRSALIIKLPKKDNELCLLTIYYKTKLKVYQYKNN